VPASAPQGVFVVRRADPRDDLDNQTEHEIVLDGKSVHEPCVSRFHALVYVLMVFVLTSVVPAALDAFATAGCIECCVFPQHTQEYSFSPRLSGMTDLLGNQPSNISTIWQAMEKRSSSACRNTSPSALSSFSSIRLITAESFCLWDAISSCHRGTS
jgi:hypothetical protein